MLSKWVKVIKIRFNEIQSVVTEAKNNKLKTDVDGKEFTLGKAESLLKDIGRGKIDKSEFKDRHTNIADDVKIILKPKVTRKPERMVQSLALSKEIIVKPAD